MSFPATLYTHECLWCKEINTSNYNDGVIDCEHCGEVFNVDDEITDEK